MYTQKGLLQKQVKSFAHAFAGIGKFVVRERHAKIHLVATLVVVLVSLTIGVSVREGIELMLVTGLVWITEMINSCLEKLIDFITLHHDPRLAFVKDVAAGAVLLAAFIALAIGLLIFIPKIK
jgi:diacylglycerol kinase